MRHTVRTDTGAVVVNAKVEPLLEGTGDAIGDAYPTETGGTAATSFLTNGQGEVTFWMDTYREQIDLRVSANGTAYLAGAVGQLFSFATFTETVAVPAPSGTLERLVYEVEKFGALDTVANTTATLKAAVAAWGATAGILRFPKNAPVLTIDDRIPMPETAPGGREHSVFEIEGNGTTITVTTAIDAFGDTVPADLTAASNRTLRHFKIHGLRFVGNGIAGQRGLVLHGTYGADIDCTFKDLDTGLDLLFALQPTVRGFAKSCRSYGLRARSLSQVAPAYATGANSGSNVGTIPRWRDYGYVGMVAQLDFFEADGWTLGDIVTEGANPQHAIRFDANNNTTVKSFNIDGWHQENVPTASALRVLNMTGGVVRVARPFWQTAQTLIDTTGCSMVMHIDDLPFIIGTPFKGEVNGHPWLFTGATAAIDPLAATYWVGGVVPNYAGGLRAAVSAETGGLHITLFGQGAFALRSNGNAFLSHGTGASNYIRFGTHNMLGLENGLSMNTVVIEANHGIPWMQEATKQLCWSIRDSAAALFEPKIAYNTPGIFAGTGTPEGVVTAGVGAIYQRTDGGAGTCLYVKESGAGTNTGWVAK